MVKVLQVGQAGQRADVADLVSVKVKGRQADGILESVQVLDIVNASLVYKHSSLPQKLYNNIGI